LFVGLIKNGRPKFEKVVDKKFKNQH